MVSYQFIDSMPFEIRNNFNKIDCLYHINTFDYPEEHSHIDYFEFTLLTDGSLENHINGKVERFDAGTLAVMTTKDIHFLKKAKKEQVRYINIMIKSKRLEEMLDRINPKLIDYISSHRYFNLDAETIHSIEKTINKIHMLSVNQFIEQSDLLISAILLLLSKIQSSSVEMVSLYTGPLEKLSELVSNPDFMTFKVEDLCKEMNYSRVQLNRIFDKQFGMSPHEYLTKYRYQYAKSLLRSTDMSVTMIAQKIGCSSQSQFNISFKKLFGETPLEYRNKK